MWPFIISRRVPQRQRNCGARKQARTAGVGLQCGTIGTMDELAAQAITSLSEARLIRFAAVQERVGMGRTAVYELIKAGKFPRPVKRSARQVPDRRRITQWIEELVAPRDAPLPATIVVACTGFDRLLLKDVRLWLITPASPPAVVRRCPGSRVPVYPFVPLGCQKAKRVSPL